MQSLFAFPPVPPLAVAFNPKPMVVELKRRHTFVPVPGGFS